MVKAKRDAVALLNSLQSQFDQEAHSLIFSTGSISPSQTMLNSGEKLIHAALSEFGATGLPCLGGIGIRVEGRMPLSKLAKEGIRFSNSHEYFNLKGE